MTTACHSIATGTVYGTLLNHPSLLALLALLGDAVNLPGGFVETNGVPNKDPARDARIGSETTNAWELSVRYTLAERLRLGLTLFDMEIANFQDTTFNGTAFVTTNLPARSKGVEFEASWLSPRGLETRFAATWADATELSMR